MYKEIVVLFLLYISVSLSAFAKQTELPTSPRVFLTLVSPSSWSMGFLGHAFISFQKPGEPIMLAQTYNYNKFYDPNDKLQVAKNWTGKLPLELEVVPLFNLFKFYGHLENRNLFLHELDLTPQETENLQLLFERDRNQKFPYSGNSNCVTKILEHINQVVSENKKIEFDPSVSATQLGIRPLFSNQDALVSRFPMMLMKILETHLIVKSRQTMDSFSVKTARTLMSIQKNIQNNAFRCQWSQATVDIIQKSFLASLKNHQRMQAYLVPYAKLVKPCISLGEFKRDVLLLLDITPNPSNDVINALFRDVEAVYAQ